MPNQSDIQNEIIKYKNSRQDILRRKCLASLCSCAQYSVKFLLSLAILDAGREK